MGARSGGGAGGGMGSRSASAPIFTGGWSGNDENTSDILIDAINKETAKALNVKTTVSWGHGRGHSKDLWVPKSTIGTITTTPSQSLKMTISKSMAQSISKQNTYNGYQMQFDFSYNT